MSCTSAPGRTVAPRVQTQRLRVDVDAALNASLDQLPALRSQTRVAAPAGA